MLNQLTPQTGERERERERERKRKREMDHREINQTAPSRQCEAVEVAETTEVATPKPLLEGCLFYLTKKVEQAKNLLLDAIRMEGGSTTTDMKRATHCLHQGPMNGKSNEGKFFNTRQIPVLHPAWLTESVEAGCLMPVSKFPPNMKVELSLRDILEKCVTTPRPSRHSSEVVLSAKDSRYLASDSNCNDNQNNNNSNSNRRILEQPEVSPPVESVEDGNNVEISKALEFLSTNQRMVVRNGQRTSLQHSKRIPGGDLDASFVSESMTDVVDDNVDLSSSKVAADASGISYGDSSGQKEKSRILNGASFGRAVGTIENEIASFVTALDGDFYSPIASTEGAHTYPKASTPKRSSEPARERSSAHTFHFHFSGVSDSDRRKLRDKVLKLGGSVATNVGIWESDTTHLVIPGPDGPQRSEKFLAAVAGGKWVLKTDYLEASISAGFFVKEEPFEWTSATSKSSRFHLINSARRWRLALQGQVDGNIPYRGAFSGMLAYCSIDPKKQEGFKRLLCAGGGQVAESPQEPGLTHAFYCAKIATQCVNEIWALRKQKVTVMRSDFLSEMLVQPEISEAMRSKYLLKESVGSHAPSAAVVAPVRNDSHDAIGSRKRKSPLPKAPVSKRQHL